MDGGAMPGLHDMRRRRGDGSTMPEGHVCESFTCAATVHGNNSPRLTLYGLPETIRAQFIDVGWWMIRIRELDVEVPLCDECSKPLRVKAEKERRDAFRLLVTYQRDHWFVAIFSTAEESEYVAMLNPRWGTDADDSGTWSTIEHDGVIVLTPAGEVDPDEHERGDDYAQWGAEEWRMQPT